MIVSPRLLPFLLFAVLVPQSVSATNNLRKRLYTVESAQEEHVGKVAENDAEGGLAQQLRSRSLANAFREEDFVMMRMMQESSLSL
mmetsp:Transcript_8397/g.12289  ORF Transcript_8397/g.12289 Transcript_8397/m.12289 type:complete len:86 (+) Transcript_8397:222-479(+)